MFSRGRWWRPTAYCLVALCAAPGSSSAQAPAPPAGAPAPPAEDPTFVEATRLFEAAAQAFNLGNFGLAIEKFTAAYDLSQATELLYNIAQAHARRYDVDRNVEDLRRARVLFDNFIKISRANGEDVRDAEGRRATIDAQLTALEEAEQRAVEQRAAEQRAAERRAAEQRAAEQRGYRPGKLAVAGYVSLGVGLLAGSGVAVTGFVSAGLLADQRAREGILALPQARESLYDDNIGKARALGYAGVGVGAALTLVGVVMIAVDAARGRSRSARASLGPGGLLVAF